MKIFIQILFIIILYFTNAFAQDLVEYDTKEKAFNKLAEMQPDDADIVFNNAEGWEKISLSSANIIVVNEGEELVEAGKIIDGKINTSWTTKSFYSKPEVTIDLGDIEEINKIIIFNRHTNNRGSGGGNNALKTMELSYSREKDINFKSLGKYDLNGPKAACIKIKGGGQICFFIDNTGPNVIEIPKTYLRYLKIKFIDAFWGNDIPDDWRDSFSLTEIKLYKE